MSTPEQVAQQAAALARVRADRIERDKAAKPYEAARKRLNESILAAIAVGADENDVAIAAKMSRQRVNQIKNRGSQ